VNDKVRQFVSFQLEGNLYGLDIRIVKEVNLNTSICPVPRSSRQIRGLVNIRGQVVLVVDIAVVFGRPPRPITNTSQVVILKTIQELKRIQDLDVRLLPEKHCDKPIGFLVDKIGDVITLEESQIGGPPPHLKECNARFVEGVAHVDERPLVILVAAEML